MLVLKATAAPAVAELEVEGPLPRHLSQQREDDSTHANGVENERSGIDIQQRPESCLPADQ